jgi:hypothetical protein
MAELQARRHRGLLVRRALRREPQQGSLARHLRAQHDDVSTCARLPAVPQGQRVRTMEPRVPRGVRLGANHGARFADRCLPRRRRDGLHTAVATVELPFELESGGHVFKYCQL